ncbi:putative sporulation protein YtxC [Thermohalobacter berrensis]|uniref:Sporulation protein YtxC n=1 Tax=Thermohalobacter berrensis TaxID=99594 RepID=A0A419T510_9FIRM|nr:putative sporulation protein YtxC [Thermohalobacter berrensis]RKD32523.1 hypothetical protein BET03_10615 [Thermohalobacter berrensis]
MKLLSIAVKDKIEEIDKRLNKQLEIFKREKINIKKEKKKLGNTTFFIYKLDDKKSKMYGNIKNIFNYYMADTITEIILDIYQEKMVDKLIEEKCCYFDKEERENIKRKTLDFLRKSPYINSEGALYNISKKAQILKILLDYLEVNNEISIQGFVDFRLKFIKKFIEDAIERNLEDFILEKEYEEFIRILKYFVDLQDSKISLVNVFIKNDDTYQLYDKDYKIINNNFFEEIAEEISENDMNEDDLLISALITIAPKNIVIHFENQKRKKEIVDIIEAVFEERVNVCKGCNFCLSSKEINNIEKKK